MSVSIYDEEDNIIEDDSDFTYQWQELTYDDDSGEEFVEDVDGANEASYTYYAEENLGCKCFRCLIVRFFCIYSACF